MAPPPQQLDDIMVDVRDGLVVFRIAGVWKYSSRSQQDLSAVIKELHEQATRLTHRASLLCEAFTVLQAQAQASEKD